MDGALNLSEYLQYLISQRNMLEKLILWWHYRKHPGWKEELIARNQDFAEFLSRIKSPWIAYYSYLSTTESKIIESEYKAAMHFCQDGHGFEKKLRQIFLPRIQQDQQFFRTYNQTYLQQHKQQYHDFFAGNGSSKKFALNNEQIDAILVNDTANIISAGPGSGKTRMLTMRIAFYVLQKKFAPDEILVLAFNRSAAEEIRIRLKQQYHLDDVEIATFHSIGLKILRQMYQNEGRSLNIESDSGSIILPMIKSALKEDEIFRAAFLTYVFKYIEPLEFESDGSVRELQYQAQVLQKYHAIDGTAVRSIAERDIANFFITHGIAYQYEPEVNWCDFEDESQSYHPDFYLPAYDIYLEHWAVEEGQEVPSWFDGDASKYLRTRKWKVKQFAKHGKTLWETDYAIWKAQCLEKELEQYCRLYHIPCIPVHSADLLQYVQKFLPKEELLFGLITQAILAAKIYGFTPVTFRRHIESQLAQMTRKSEAFFSLVFPIYELYEQHLRRHGKIDFQDMISLAVTFLAQNSDSFENTPEKSFFTNYRMIFVDEFQDISWQRLRLIQLLAGLNDACRICCVRDDWQAIYGFTGASNKFMVYHDQYFESPRLLQLLHNYRNPPEILQFGQAIIQKTKDFLPKTFHPTNVPGTRPIYLTRIDARTEAHYRIAQAEAVRSLILNLIRTGTPPSDIMVLARYNFLLAQVQEVCQAPDLDMKIPIALEKEGKIVIPGVQFFTMHRSKGLEAPVVIIVGIHQGLLGVPSQMNDEVEMQFINPDLSDPADEERRLFFVAVTRAIKQLYLFTWLNHESEFLPARPDPETIAYRLCVHGNVPCKILGQTDHSLLIQLESEWHEMVEASVFKDFVFSPYQINPAEPQEIRIIPWNARYFKDPPLPAENIRTIIDQFHEQIEEKIQQLLTIVRAKSLPPIEAFNYFRMVLAALSQQFACESEENYYMKNDSGENLCPQPVDVIWKKDRHKPIIMIIHRVLSDRILAILKSFHPMLVVWLYCGEDPTNAQFRISSERLPFEVRIIHLKDMNWENALVVVNSDASPVQATHKSDKYTKSPSKKSHITMMESNNAWEIKPQRHAYSHRYRNHEIVFIYGTLLHSTEKAVLFSGSIGTRKAIKQWIPKKVITDENLPLRQRTKIGVRGWYYNKFVDDNSKSDSYYI
jgi:DNA helicase-4